MDSYQCLTGQSGDTSNPTGGHEEFDTKHFPGPIDQQPPGNFPTPSASSRHGYTRPTSTYSPVSPDQHRRPYGSYGPSGFYASHQVPGEAPEYDADTRANLLSYSVFDLAQAGPVQDTWSSHNHFQHANNNNQAQFPTQSAGIQRQSPYFVSHNFQPPLRPLDDAQIYANPLAQHSPSITLQYPPQDYNALQPGTGYMPAQTPGEGIPHAFPLSVYGPFASPASHVAGPYSFPNTTSQCISAATDTCVLPPLELGATHQTNTEAATRHNIPTPNDASTSNHWTAVGPGNPQKSSKSEQDKIKDSKAMESSGDKKMILHGRDTKSRKNTAKPAETYISYAEYREMGGIAPKCPDGMAYDHNGQITVNTRFNAEEIRRFVDYKINEANLSQEKSSKEKFSERELSQGELSVAEIAQAELKRKLATKKFRMWIQTCPTQLAPRMKGDDNKCRYASCEANSKIESGYLRVAFDEFPDLEEKMDPLKPSFVLHLYCFEKIYGRDDFDERFLQYFTPDDRPTLKCESKNNVCLNRDSSNDAAAICRAWFKSGPFGYQFNAKKEMKFIREKESYFDTLSCALNLHHVGRIYDRGCVEADEETDKFKQKCLEEYKEVPPKSKYTSEWVVVNNKICQLYRTSARQKKRGENNVGIPPRSQATIELHLGSLIERKDRAMQRRNWRPTEEEKAERETGKAKQNIEKAHRVAEREKRRAEKERKEAEKERKEAEEKAQNAEKEREEAQRAEEEAGKTNLAVEALGSGTSQKRKRSVRGGQKQPRRSKRQRLDSPGVAEGPQAVVQQYGAPQAQPVASMQDHEAAGPQQQDSDSNLLSFLSPTAEQMMMHSVKLAFTDYKSPSNFLEPDFPAEPPGRNALPPDTPPLPHTATAAPSRKRSRQVEYASAVGPSSKRARTSTSGAAWAIAQGNQGVSQPLWLQEQADEDLYDEPFRNRARP